MCGSALSVAPIIMTAPGRQPAIGVEITIMNQPSVGINLDVQSFINAQPLSRYQWRVVILCFLIVFLDGLDTAAMGFIAPALSQDWGIDRASLGPVMSAALIGMVFGALGSGPLADRFGRKVVLVGAVLVFGAFSLASAYSANVDQLLVLRFLTGLGLGAGMPNATTLLSEYTPERHKSLLVTSMFCGFNLGMAGGGFISAKLIPAFGWHSLLLIGGILPLLLAVVLLVWLPESARYLVVRNRGTDRVRKTLSPIEPNLVAQAGRPGALTIATNMAGRGTDILLGGNWEVEVASLDNPTPEQIAQIKADWQKRHQAVLESGGLQVIASERHESRRIDNQLRGLSLIHI